MAAIAQGHYWRMADPDRLEATPCVRSHVHRAVGLAGPGSASSSFPIIVADPV